MQWSTEAGAAGGWPDPFSQPASASPPWLPVDDGGFGGWIDWIGWFGWWWASLAAAGLAGVCAFACAARRFAKGFVVETMGMHGAAACAATANAAGLQHVAIVTTNMFHALPLARRLCRSGFPVFLCQVPEWTSPWGEHRTAQVLHQFTGLGDRDRVTLVGLGRPCGSLVNRVNLLRLEADRRRVFSEDLAEFDRRPRRPASPVASAPPASPGSTDSHGASASSGSSGSRGLVPEVTWSDSGGERAEHGTGPGVAGTAGHGDTPTPGGRDDVGRGAVGAHDNSDDGKDSSTDDGTESDVSVRTVDSFSVELQRLADSGSNSVLRTRAVTVLDVWDGRAVASHQANSDLVVTGRSLIDVVGRALGVARKVGWVPPSHVVQLPILGMGVCWRKATADRVVAFLRLEDGHASEGETESEGPPGFAGESEGETESEGPPGFAGEREDMDVDVDKNAVAAHAKMD